MVKHTNKSTNEPDALEMATVQATMATRRPPIQFRLSLILQTNNLNFSPSEISAVF